jgi:hypothetical protein
MIKREGLQYEEHEKRHRQLGHRKRKGLQRAFGDRKVRTQQTAVVTSARRPAT